MEKTIEDYKTELLELKSEHKDALEKVQAELKAKDELNKKLSDKEKALLEKKAKDDESSKKDKTEMKSLTDKKDKDFLELKSKFDHVNIELISSGGGVFEVTLNNDLIFSKRALDRFPDDGEIEKLIRENLN